MYECWYSWREENNMNTPRAWVIDGCEHCGPISGLLKKNSKYS